MLPDTSELDSKLAINTDAMESVDNLGFEQQTQDPCSPRDRIMCKVIDDMLSSNGLFWGISILECANWSIDVYSEIITYVNHDSK